MNKTNELMELMVKRCREATDELATAREAKAKALQVARVLPEELLNTSWWCFKKTADAEWYMETSVISDLAKADGLIKALKVMGVYDIKSSFRTFNNTWVYTGKFQVGEDTITIKIDGGSQPPACRVEKIVEMKEVTSYKAICEETGEPLS